MGDTEKSRRLFVALWPDPVTRQRLAGVQKNIGRIERLKSARPVPVANLHITAHFLGAVSHGVYQELRASFAGVRAETCTLVIDRWGYFPKPRVLWLGGDTTPALDDLVGQTQARIQACIKAYRQNRFLPHITVFRKARHPVDVDAFEPIEWRIDRFVLVESVTLPTGAEYTVIDEWMLG